MSWHQVALLLVIIASIGLPMLYVFGIKEKEMYPNVKEIHNVQALRIENAKLRLENAKLRDAMYTKAGKHALQHMDEDELRIWATQQAELIDELRELARIMAYCMHDGRECDQCAMNGADMNVEIDQLLACDGLYERLMEMGIGD